MSTPEKWWLISDEDVQAIKKGLVDPAPEMREGALHALDSGLHKTDDVPEDWKADLKCLLCNAEMKTELLDYDIVWWVCPNCTYMVKYNEASYLPPEEAEE